MHSPDSPSPLPQYTVKPLGKVKAPHTWLVYMPLNAGFLPRPEEMPASPCLVLQQCHILSPHPPLPPASNRRVERNAARFHQEDSNPGG